MIHYRFAKKSDAKALAAVHMVCAAHQKGGFFHLLGRRFLTEYYKIEVANKYSVILMAEDGQGRCLGFHSGTIEAKEHYSNLKKNRVRLMLALIPQFLVNPKLLLDVLKRYSAVANENSKIEFGIKEGPRGEYWGWLPSDNNPVESLNLHKKWHQIIRELGVSVVRSEVDITNDRVYRSIKLMGAEILKEIILPDGRKRALVQYTLIKS